VAELLIRRAVPADADELGDGHVAAWRWAYRDLMPATFLASMRPERQAEWWHRRFAEGWLDTWVAESQGRIVGHAGSAVARDEDAPPGAAELVMINVIEEYARQGVGRALMETVEEHWRALGVEVAVLWVLADNDRARSFYARLGWLPDGATGQYELPGVSLPQLRLRKSYA
jgi:GNAT superfamily N-acetyltransferase